MDKLLILSIPDHEEHIINKIMELIADEPEFIHLPACHAEKPLISVDF